jgi:hypothetical protein
MLLNLFATMLASLFYKYKQSNSNVLQNHLDQIYRIYFYSVYICEVFLNLFLFSLLQLIVDYYQKR